MDKNQAPEPTVSRTTALREALSTLGEISDQLLDELQETRDQIKEQSEEVTSAEARDALNVVDMKVLITSFRAVDLATRLGLFRVVCSRAGVWADDPADSPD